MTAPLISSALTYIGFSWRSHRTALWWLWMLYRRPLEFHRQISILKWNIIAKIIIKLSITAVILYYILVYSLIFIFYLTDLESYFASCFSSTLLSVRQMVAWASVG